MWPFGLHHAYQSGTVGIRRAKFSKVVRERAICAFVARATALEMAEPRLLVAAKFGIAAGLAPVRHLQKSGEVPTTEATPLDLKRLRLFDVIVLLFDIDYVYVRMRVSICNTLSRPIQVLMKRPPAASPTHTNNLE